MLAKRFHVLERAAVEKRQRAKPGFWEMPSYLARSGLLALALAALPAGLPALAEDYPSRPVTIIVPLAAGTGMDTIVRLYGEKLAHGFGKAVIIDNRPGASTMLGTGVVATAAPDGHTLLVATSSAFAINPFLSKHLSYDPERDFIPISLYVKSPFVLIVNPALPVRTVPELIEYARKSATPLTYSSPGVGGAPHLAAEFMKQRFGLDITHVPYRNSPQSIADVAAGHVTMAFAEAGASLPLIRDGKLRALAVSSATRLIVLPEVPPFAEAAGIPDFEAVSWHVLFAPAKTPQPIVTRLYQDMKQIMSAPEMQQRIANLGLIPLDPPSLEGVATYIKSEREKWGALVRKLGLEGSQ